MERLSKINERIKKLSKELSHLNDLRYKRNTRIAIKYRGRFVKMIREDGIHVRHEITDDGLKELSKYRREYVESGLKLMFDNPGISYTVESIFCMICGDSENNYSYMQVGIAPRFAACPRHGDFICLWNKVKIKG